MPQLQVTVNKLNRRTSPVTDFADKSNVVEVVKNGFTFESVAAIENNLGVWHQGHDGHWTWGGGATEAIEPVSIAVLPLKLTDVNVQQYLDDRFDGISLNGIVDYNFLLNIPQEIKETNGKDSVIGILDQAISTNINFENILRPGNILAENSPSNHGNFIAGIIGSKATSSIKGICSLGTILDLTYKDVSGILITDDAYYAKLVTSIKSFENKKVIVNVSRLADESLKFALDKLSGLTHVFFVCSAGTESDLLNIDNSPLVDNSQAISVGTASLGFLNSNSSKIDKRLNVVLPILDFVSFNNDGLSFSRIRDVSSSWGTAVISSLIALFYSSNQLNNNSTKADIITQIQNVSKSPDNASNFLNPLNF
jgi:hypothetical protein